MGLFAPTMKWIYLAKLRYRIDFDHTLTLGRQYCELEEWEKAAKCLRKSGGELAIQRDGYTESFWKWLGSKKTEFLDYSAYEGANVIWDLNQPIPDDLRAKYSVVVDGGTLEHVYNYPQGVKNVMEMVELGGHLIFLTPGNGWCGHGFYQFSPCLFWDLLNPANGYEVLEISLLDARKIDTHKMIRRVENRNNIETKGRGYLLVVAKRVGDVPERVEVQQGSYRTIWENMKEHSQKNSSEAMKKIKSKLKKWRVITALYEWFRRFTEKREYYDIDKEIEFLSKSHAGIDSII